MPYQGSSPRTSPASEAPVVAPSSSAPPPTCTTTTTNEECNSSHSSSHHSGAQVLLSLATGSETEGPISTNHKDVPAVIEPSNSPGNEPPTHAEEAATTASPSSSSHHHPPVTPSPLAHSQKEREGGTSGDRDSQTRNNSNMQMSLHASNGLVPSPIKLSSSRRNNPEEPQASSISLQDNDTKNTSKRKSPDNVAVLAVEDNDEEEEELSVSRSSKVPRRNLREKDASAPSSQVTATPPKCGNSPVQAEHCSDSKTLISPASSAATHEEPSKAASPRGPSTPATVYAEMAPQERHRSSTTAAHSSSSLRTPQHALSSSSHYAPSHHPGTTPLYHHPHPTAPPTSITPSLGGVAYPHHHHATLAPPSVPTHPAHHSSLPPPHYVPAAPPGQPWMHPVALPPGYYAVPGYAAAPPPPQYYTVAIHPTPATAAAYGAPPPHMVTTAAPPPQPHLVHSSAAQPLHHHHHQKATTKASHHHPLAAPPSPPTPPSPPPPPPPRKKNRDSTKSEEVKKSIEEWQKTRATIGNKARCIPVEHPTKAKNIVANPEKVDFKLPDFPLLVNFPEHLTRGQTRGTGEHKGLAPEGKRHCVMCGQLRICSSSANRMNRSTAPTTNSSPNNAHNPNEADSSSSTVHIIPRQNKGVCTACDVTVWTVLKHGGNTSSSSTNGSNLEIKWCKGCKNFRPWAAFGDKGLATKCARCRHRQREKYAMQKKQGTTGMTATPSSSLATTTPTKYTSGSYDPYGHHHHHHHHHHQQKDDDLLAAQGLSNLMRAQNA